MEAGRQEICDLQSPAKGERARGMQNGRVLNDIGHRPIDYNPIEPYGILDGWR
jgi:hypothetical protein